MSRKDYGFKRAALQVSAMRTPWQTEQAHQRMFEKVLASESVSELVEIVKNQLKRVEARPSPVTVSALLRGVGLLGEKVERERQNKPSGPSVDDLIKRGFLGQPFHGSLFDAFLAGIAKSMSGTKQQEGRAIRGNNPTCVILDFDPTVSAPVPDVMRHWWAGPTPNGVTETVETNLEFPNSTIELNLTPAAPRPERVMFMFRTKTRTLRCGVSGTELEGAYVSRIEGCLQGDRRNGDLLALLENPGKQLTQTDMGWLGRLARFARERKLVATSEGPGAPIWFVKPDGTRMSVKQFVKALRRACPVVAEADESGSSRVRQFEFKHQIVGAHIGSVPVVHKLVELAVDTDQGGPTVKAVRASLRTGLMQPGVEGVRAITMLADYAKNTRMEGFSFTGGRNGSYRVTLPDGRRMSLTTFLKTWSKSV